MKQLLRETGGRASQDRLISAKGRTGGAEQASWKGPSLLLWKGKVREGDVLSNLQDCVAVALP